MRWLRPRDLPNYRLKLDANRVDPERVRELERENEEFRMECDVLKRSVVLWVKEATQR